MNRMFAGLAKPLFVVPWLTVAPIGFDDLSPLVASRATVAPGR